MTTFIELAPHAFYLPGAVNVGVAATAAGDAVLIDSGGDKDYGRAIRKAVAAAGLTVRAIVNTHSHADHYGGNDYLVRNLGREPVSPLSRFSVPVWAPTFEEAILRYPFLEPMYLFGGAAPLKGLQNKWLMAKPSPVDHVYDADDGQLEIAGLRLTLHRTDGHAVRQVAIGHGPVCYAADAFFGPDVLAKYEIPFTHDVAGQIAALRALIDWPYDWFVPGHGDPVRRVDLPAAVERNLDAIHRAATLVRRAVGAAATTSEVVHAVTGALAAPPGTLSTYFLMHSCVLAYLAHLTDQGAIEPVVEGGALRWQAR
ncbi:MAG: MBL fold metallo-hydrolase [Ardenticatenaceae bacterium]|nr:MBL fold metallo-hydrolase [Ardenticatenaceae bacterium]